MTCQCKVCTDHKRWEAALVHDEASRGAFEEVMDLLANRSMDLNHYEAIHEGTWPQAVEILTCALEHAKAKQNAGISIL
jgi:hypothetical protein